MIDSFLHVTRQVATLYDRTIESNQEVVRGEEERALEGRFCWAVARDLRGQVEERRSMVVVEQGAIAKLEGVVEHLWREKAMVDREVVGATGRLREEREKHQGKEQGLQGRRREVERLRGEKKAADSRVRRLGEKKVELEREVRVLEEQVKVEEGRGVADREAMRLKVVVKKEIVEIDVGKAVEELEGLVAKEKKITKYLEKLERERLGLQEKVAVAEAGLEEVRGEEEEELSGYGRLTARLVAELRAAAASGGGRFQFERAPVGPVGRHLAAGPPRLAGLLEAELGRQLLGAFLVHGEQDRAVLRRLMAEVFGEGSRQPTIHTCPFLPRRHQVLRLAGLTTVLDCLVISGTEEQQTVVFNHLVDLKAVEQVVVCRGHREAAALTIERRAVPAGVAYAVTEEFYRYLPPSAAASYRSFYMERGRGGLLVSSRASLLQARGQAVAKARAALAEVQAMVEQQAREEAQVRGRREEVGDRLGELREQEQVLAGQLLEEEQEVVKRSLNSTWEKAHRMEEELVVARRQVEEAVTKLQECVTKANILTKEMEELRCLEEPLLEDIKKAKDKVVNKRKEIANVEKAIASRLKKVKELESEIKSLEEKETKHLEAAGGAPPQESDLTMAQLNARLRRVRSRRKEAGGGEAREAREAAVAEYRGARDQFERAKRRLEGLEVLVEQMEEGEGRRQDNLLIIRSTITSTLRRRFNWYIEKFGRQVSLCG